MLDPELAPALVLCMLLSACGASDSSPASGAAGAGGTGGSADAGGTGGSSGAAGSLDAGGDTCATPSAGDLLAADQPSPSALAVADGFVYWAYAATSPGAPDGGVRRVALSGGCVEEILSGLGAGPPPATTQVLVTGGQVYVIDTLAKKLVHAPAAGGAATVLYEGVDAPYDLAADADALYFSSPFAGDVLRAPFDGSGLQTLASGQTLPLGVAVDGTHVYFACDGDPGSGFTNGSFARVAKAPGAQVETLAGPVVGGQDVAVSGARVFLLQFGAPGPTPTGAVWKLDLPGSTPQKILDPIGQGIQIETDGTTAFVAGTLPSSGAGVFRVDADGSHGAMVAAVDPPPPFALAPGYVVYAAGGEIRRVAR